MNWVKPTHYDGRSYIRITNVFIYLFIHLFIKNPHKRGSEYNKSNKTFVKNSMTSIHDYYNKTNSGNGNSTLYQ